MYKGVLVESKISDGKRLVTALDRSGLDVRTAFWFYDSEIERWKLVIHFPKVDQLQHQEAYELIRQAMLSMDPPLRFFLSDVMIQSSRSKLVHAITLAASTEPDALIDLPVNHLFTGDILIEEAHVYRAAA